MTSTDPSCVFRDAGKWMHRILAYSYKVREWRAGVYTRESGPESMPSCDGVSLGCPSYLIVVPVLISGSQGLCVWVLQMGDKGAG